ncbi:MAG: SAM hydrolase/SAM-dependent halogenase family protein [Candidatus Limnocylindria bacterium]
MAAGPFISLLTDFGFDTAPAVCRGVMLGICPEARISDLTHNVRKFAVRDGAFLLWSALPYQPVGVHVAVVDPGVGTPRRAVVLRAGRGDLLVGPDNGLLLPAADRLGGIAAVREATNPTLMAPVVSSTFHARDLFSPVAAHLAAGLPLDHVGPALDPATLVRLPWPTATLRDGGLDSAVLFVDSFGNCRLAGSMADLAAVAAPEPGRAYRVLAPSGVLTVPWAPSFGHVAPGETLLYDDADYDGPALGVNRGSAAERLGLALDMPLRIEEA